MIKTIINSSALLITVLIMLSCDSKEDTGFKIVFSDGNQIEEQEVEFYDSSSCIFFLKKNLSLEYSSGSDDSELTEFKLQINEDIVYDGIIWPAMVSMMSPVPIYISCCTYPKFESNVLVIKFVDFNTDATDTRNNQDLIDYFDKKHLLHHGLTYSIDSINLSTQNDSSVIIFSTIENHDNINYYIPDPEKMGDEQFSYYTSRVYLKSAESDEYYSPRYENATADWNNLDMGDLTILGGDSQISFSFEIKYGTQFTAGIYEIDYRFGNLDLCRYDYLEMEQAQGRIWVGEYFLHIDNIFLQ